MGSTGKIAARPRRPRTLRLCRPRPCMALPSHPLYLRYCRHLLNCLSSILLADWVPSALMTRRSSIHHHHLLSESNPSSSRVPASGARVPAHLFSLLEENSCHCEKQLISDAGRAYGCLSSCCFVFLQAGGRAPLQRQRHPCSPAAASSLTIPSSPRARPRNNRQAASPLPRAPLFPMKAISTLPGVSTKTLTSP